MRLRHSAALVLALAASVGAAQPRAAGGACREACERYVKDGRLRTTICGRCVVGENDRGVWALGLAEENPNASALQDMLADEDWAVRWGGVRGLAKARGVVDLRQLSTWILEAHGQTSLLACETALHVAGQKKEATSVALARGGAMGPSAATMCWQKKDALFTRVEKQLYAQAPYQRREALRHLAAFMGVSPARIALGSLKERPTQGDAILAQLLLEEAAAGGPPVGRDLLSAVKKDETALADRLLVHWAPKVDAERQRLKSEVENERRDAVVELSNLGPLGARELEATLGDPVTRVALAAARALARGEGLTVSAMVKKQLAAGAAVSEASRLRWLELLGRSQEKDCATVLPALLADEKLSETVRARAAVAWAACGEKDALPALKELLASKSVALRAGAVEALGELTRVAQAPELVSAAFKDPQPQVQAAAARAAGALRLSSRAMALVAMLEAGDAGVRLAAAQALGLIPTPQAGPALAKMLGQESDANNRLACVAALAELGGPEALAALTRAAKNDGDQKVKLAAAAALRRLGFEPSPGTLRP
jgi:HEAT repeats